MANQNPSSTAMFNQSGVSNYQNDDDGPMDFEDEIDEDMDDNTKAPTLMMSEEDAESWITEYDPTKEGYGKTNTFDATFTGKAACKVFESFVDTLTPRQLLIFELGAKFSLLLGKGKSTSFEPVPQVDHDQKSENIKSIAEITKVAASQHALPDQVFDAKLNKKELIKNQHLSKNNKKQLLYLLIDASGSMARAIDGTDKGLLTRASLASTLGMALTKKVMGDGGWVYLRFFAGCPGSLITAKSKEDTEYVCLKLALANYNGGGTCIESAIRAAAKDISEAKDELARAELLMITDAEDSVNVTSIKNVLKKVELNVLDVAGKAVSTVGYKGLKDIATKYYKANEKELNLNKMVELL
jgi:hypothetical protein